MQCEVIKDFPDGSLVAGQVVNSDDLPDNRTIQLINQRWLKPVVQDSNKYRVLIKFSDFAIGDEVDTSNWIEPNKGQLIAQGLITQITEPSQAVIKENPRKKTRKRRKINGK